MRRVVLAAVVSAVAALAPALAAANPDAVVSVSPTPAQKITAFGASGAWWPNDLDDFPRTVRRRAAALLFSRSGIALSEYRYNIGAGGDGVSNPARRAPTFVVRPGVYDWSRDSAGVRYLRLARDFGVSELTGFANSAPGVWKTNRRACGGTLVTGAEAAYADYLTDVVDHLRRAAAITLKSVSPVNEPDHAFGACNQEGMRLDVGRRATLVSAVARSLAERTPYATVIADESSLVASQFLSETPGWAGTQNVAAQLGSFAHHLYDYPDARTLEAARALAARYGKPISATEVCCWNGTGFGPGYDPSIRSGLWLAATVWRTLEHEGSVRFDWWTALSPALGCSPATRPGCPARRNATGWNDGLLYYDGGFRQTGNHALYATKRFWAFGNFSRYVRPGSVRHPASGAPTGVRVAAFRCHAAWVVVAVDRRPAPAGRLRVRVKLPVETTETLEPVTAARTSASEDLAPVALGRVGTSQSVDVSLVPRSVTTHVVRVVVPRSRRAG